MNVIKPYKEIEIQIDSINLNGNLRLADKPVIGSINT